MLALHNILDLQRCSYDWQKAERKSVVAAKILFPIIFFMNDGAFFSLHSHLYCSE